MMSIHQPNSDDSEATRTSDILPMSVLYGLSIATDERAPAAV